MIKSRPWAVKEENNLHCVGNAAALLNGISKLPHIGLKLIQYEVDFKMAGVENWTGFTCCLP